MQNEWSDLEPQQYAALYPEDDAPLPDPRRSRLRTWVYIGTGIFGMLLLAGFGIRFPDEISLPFVLRATVPERIYRYPYPVYVEASFVQSGKTVRAGDALLRISSPEIVALIGAERAAAAALENLRRYRPQTQADSRAISGLEQAQVAGSIRQLAQQRTTLDRTWASNSHRLRYESDEAVRRLSQHRSLFESKLISAQELRTYEAEQLRAADALATATEAYHRDAAALESEQARLQLDRRARSRESDRQQTEFRSDSLAVADALSHARQVIHNTFGEYTIDGGSLVLRAGAAATVAYVFDGDRELPQSAILLRLRPQTGSLYASGQSSGALIGKLQRGQTVYLRIASFPSYEWGAVRGHIERLSLTPDEKGAFSIHVAIDDLRRLQGRLQTGMDGRMAIQLQARSFFGYFARNLKRHSARLRGDDNME